MTRAHFFRWRQTSPRRKLPAKAAAVHFCRFAPDCLQGLEELGLVRGDDRLVEGRLKALDRLDAAHVSAGEDDRLGIGVIRPKTELEELFGRQLALAVVVEGAADLVARRPLRRIGTRSIFITSAKLSSGTYRGCARAFTSSSAIQAPNSFGAPDIIPGRVTLRAAERHRFAVCEQFIAVAVLAVNITGYSRVIRFSSVRTAHMA